MYIDFLREKFAAAKDADALVWRDQVYPYSHILEEIDNWVEILDSEEVSAGSVVSVEADFSRRKSKTSLAGSR